MGQPMKRWLPVLLDVVGRDMTTVLEKRPDSVRYRNHIWNPTPKQKAERGWRFVTPGRGHRPGPWGTLA